MEKIINDFFNFDTPCPKEIQDCEKLRATYKEEIDKSTASGCSQCARNGIKSKYIEIVWKQAVTSVTSQGSQ